MLNYDMFYISGLHSGLYRDQHVFNVSYDIYETTHFLYFRESQPIIYSNM